MRLEDRWTVAQWFIAAAFLALLAVAWPFSLRQREAAIELTLQSHASTLALRVADTLSRSTEALHAVASLFMAFDDLRPEAFERFAAGFLQEEPSLLLLEWRPVVPGPERAAFVAQVRAQGRPDFRLWEPDAHDRPIAAKARAEHVPVLYMVSRHPTTDTTGLDLAWSPERMRSKWEARDSGRARVSGFFRVVTGPRGDFSPMGIAITLPVYRAGVVPDTRAARRKALLGYVAGVYDLAALLAPHLDAPKQTKLQVSLADVDGDWVRLIGRGSQAAGWYREERLLVLGREWRLRLGAASKAAIAAPDTAWFLVPIAIAIMGAIVLLFLVLLRRNTRQLVHARDDLARALATVKASEAHLLELSRNDPLTGLFNRRSFLEILDGELCRANRHHFASSLMMLDLDHFKSINDGWGHPVGDRVLMAFADLCIDTTRATDAIARLGGEEFGILLPHTPLATARDVAERLRRRVEALILPMADGERAPKLTVSIGLAGTAQATSVDELLKTADQALYSAKRQGRNRVVVVH